MKEKRKIIVGMYVSLFWASFGYIQYSVLMSVFIQKYALTLSRAGLIGSVLCVGQLVSQFICHPISKRYNKLHMTILGVAASLIAFVMMVTAISYPVLLMAFLIDGASVSFLNVVICAYISDEYGDRRSSYLNLLHGVYGVGSMIGPVLSTMLLAQGIPWEYGYVFIIVTGLLVWAFLLLKRMSPYGGVRSGGETESFVRLLRDRRLLLICGCTFLCVGFDVVIGTYMAAYLENVLQAGKIAGLSITAYWGGSAAGRFLYPPLFSKFEPKRFLIAANVVSAGLLLVGGCLKSAGVMFAVMSLVGMLSGMNYPMEIGFACEVFPDNSISATNATCFMASIGGVIAPLIAGKLIDTTGYHAMIIQGVSMLLLISLLLTILSRRSKDVRL